MGGAAAAPSRGRARLGPFIKATNDSATHRPRGPALLVIARGARTRQRRAYGRPGKLSPTLRSTVPVIARFSLAALALGFRIPALAFTARQKRPTFARQKWTGQISDPPRRPPPRAPSTDTTKPRRPSPTGLASLAPDLKPRYLGQARAATSRRFGSCDSGAAGGRAAHRPSPFGRGRCTSPRTRTRGWS